MNLPHLLLMIFGTNSLSLLFGWLLSQAGAQASFRTLCCLSVPVALFVTLLLAWPISRLLRLTPLMIFAGPCPGCRRRPPGWWAIEAEKERLLLTCGACDEPLELWLTRTPPIRLLSATIPVFNLRWPEFLGIWKEVRCRNIKAICLHHNLRSATDE
jgi:hypothetical protein